MKHMEGRSMGSMGSDLLAKVSMKARLVVGLIVLGLLCYVLGVRFLLFPAVVFLVYRYQPLPVLFRSVCSRLFASTVFAFTLLPIAGALQFLLFKHISGVNFTYTAVIFAALAVAVLLFAPDVPQVRRKLFAMADMWGLAAAFAFVVPFLPFLMASPTVHILQMAGFQVTDAANHFTSINHYSQVQFLNLGNYPAGFHFGVAFLQQGLLGQMYDLSWSTNALLFFGQYVLAEGSLAFAAYYLCLTLFEVFRTKTIVVRSWLSHGLLALCLAPVLTVFYLLPLFAQGFLNYIYLLAVMILAFTFLIEVRETTDDAKRRTAVFGYIVLAYGAISTWSLLAPLVAGIGYLFLLPPNITLASLWHEIRVLRNLPTFAVTLLMVIFMYYQATTVKLASAEGINATGNMSGLNYLVLLAALALIIALAFSKRTTDGQKKLMYCLYLPGFAFVGVLALFQYFAVGEVRYYASKSAVLLEVMSLALAVAFFVRTYFERMTADLRSAVLLPFVPIIFVTLLMSALPNPLIEIRSVLRPASGIQNPQYYSHDARLPARLGNEGKLKSFNTIVLHYIPGIPKLDGYTQLSSRANIFREGATTPNPAAYYTKNKKSNPAAAQSLAMRDCSERVYSSVEYAPLSDAQQQFVITGVLKCAQIANSQHLGYYVVTDPGSVAYMKRTFGNAVTVVD